MNVRKFKSDKNALIAEGNRIVSSSDDAKFIRKENIKVVVTSDPNAFGYTVWDEPSLSDYIACVRQCQRLLHELEFSLIRPQTFPSKGNEENLLRDEFKKTSQSQKTIRTQSYATRTKFISWQNPRLPAPGIRKAAVRRASHIPGINPLLIAVL